MSTKSSTVLFLLFTFFLLFAVGCKNPGCNDPEAINYDPSANEDDGSCMYEGSLSFFADDESRGQISVYVDSVYRGKIISFYGQSLPDCLNAHGIVTIEKPVGYYDYYAISDDSTVWSGQVEIQKNSCTLFLLE